MGAELVHYTVSDAIAEITLDRAPVNALSMPLIDALLEALAKARTCSIAECQNPARLHRG